ncbi:MAG TPA: class III extradiol ring-cleavage dioxygenase [Sphingorhabdus sp.]|uniref:DODA-type extradiol aromatic ring-opening family dioxygenase n=1 Tax=Sphingorhabdus sp. TaxID=1902408 RepID=UPI002CABF7A9|nr:class III extradiol ring-cleavage dioxygenase [Sphingorhabdus sp.]HMT42407.1 class III extradiol ring-cleavage dioxygenase [Sphingorhabdus sp.]HMU21222.1 class III extradiol ring-cleavage dioxygenase [Sphingorhabdus sp.]
MTRQPALFVSHGAPTIVIDDTPARHFLAGLAGELPTRPDAIVMISAHHDEPLASITSAEQPGTIHDFGSFPDALYRMRYPAPGSPELAQRIARMLDDADIANRLDPERGFDHGTWTPLMLAWPNADIPVVQVSINSRATPDYHYRLGLALEALRDNNVLVIGSGAITHNLYAFFRGGYAADAPTQPWVTDFLGWLDRQLMAGGHDAVLGAIGHAPHGTDNHPTMDHILPLFAALGAGGLEGKATKLYASVEYGVLAMDAWRFD